MRRTSPSENNGLGAVIAVTIMPGPENTFR
jgi:hypothetical protein